MCRNVSFLTINCYVAVAEYVNGALSILKFWDQGGKTITKENKCFFSVPRFYFGLAKSEEGRIKKRRGHRGGGGKKRERGGGGEDDGERKRKKDKGKEYWVLVFINNLAWEYSKRNHKLALSSPLLSLFSSSLTGTVLQHPAIGPVLFSLYRLSFGNAIHSCGFTYYPIL